MAELRPLTLCGLEQALDKVAGPAGRAAARALIHVSRAEYTDAQRELKDALSQDPACAAAAGLLGWTLALTGDAAQADANFKRAVRKAPGEAWPLVLRALAWRSWNRGEGACRMIEAALDKGAGVRIRELADDWRGSLGLSAPAALKAPAKGPRHPTENSGPARKLRPRK